MGTCPYWVGKDAFMPYLNEKFTPQYLNFLKSLKKTLDPNNIMNPGALGIGLE
jgi:FAD/FMN-containing dehydrogenase